MLIGGAVGLGAPSGAAAATVSSFGFNGSFANAYYRFDPAACVRWTTSVDAVDGRSHDNLTGQTSRSTASITIIRQDVCDPSASTVWYSGWTYLGPDDFDVAGNLGSASLNTTIVVLPYADCCDRRFPIGFPRTVRIALTWDGSNAPMTHDTSNSTDPFWDYGRLVTVRDSTMLRAAVASGTISDGTIDYTSDHQSASARLTRTTQGIVAIKG
ncbi:MAG TPA: hypothetical protein VFB41_09085 [Solirubrobacteraceae bacterium]|nr:hypothetical protein [Solirubrobacteraceae bacterium]